MQIESSARRRKHTHKIGTPRTSWGPVCDRGIPRIGDPKAYAAWKKANPHLFAEREGKAAA